MRMNIMPLQEVGVEEGPWAREGTLGLMAVLSSQTWGVMLTSWNRPMLYTASMSSFAWRLLYTCKHKLRRNNAAYSRQKWLSVSLRACSCAGPVFTTWSRGVC